MPQLLWGGAARTIIDDNMQIKKTEVIQLTNLIPDARFKNPQRGRVYYAKGISPCLNGIGGVDHLNLNTYG